MRVGHQSCQGYSGASLCQGNVDFDGYVSFCSADLQKSVLFLARFVPFTHLMRESFAIAVRSADGARPLIGTLNRAVQGAQFRELVSPLLRPEILTALINRHQFTHSLVVVVDPQIQQREGGINSPTAWALSASGSLHACMPRQFVSMEAAGHSSTTWHCSAISKTRRAAGTQLDPRGT